MLLAHIQIQDFNEQIKKYVKVLCLYAYIYVYV